MDEPTRSGARAWGWTLAAVALFLAGHLVVMPGVNWDQYRATVLDPSGSALPHLGDWLLARAAVSVMALGLLPLLCVRGALALLHPAPKEPATAAAGDPDAPRAGTYRTSAEDPPPPPAPAPRRTERLACVAYLALCAPSAFALVLRLEALRNTSFLDGVVYAPGWEFRNVATLCLLAGAAATWPARRAAWTRTRACQSPPWCWPRANASAPRPRRSACP